MCRRTPRLLLTQCLVDHAQAVSVGVDRIPLAAAASDQDALRFPLFSNYFSVNAGGPTCWCASSLAILRPSTRAVEGFAGVWVTIRACGEVGFRLTAEAEIGRSRFADGPSAVLSIEFRHAVGGGCAVRDLGFRFFAHVLPSSSGRPPARSRNVVLGWW